jgi:hypothetical protein
MHFSGPLIFILTTMLNCALSPANAAGQIPAQATEAVRNQLLNEARNKASDLENDGQLLEARNQWWIVDALSQTETSSQSNIIRLEGKIRSLATRALARGQAALAQGNVEQSRQSFLSVLQLVPGHLAAMNGLRKIESETMLRELRKRGAEGPAAAPVPNS